jgi:hypothetical protein
VRGGGDGQEFGDAFDDSKNGGGNRVSHGMFKPSRPALISFS